MKLLRMVEGTVRDCTHVVPLSWPLGVSFLDKTFILANTFFNNKKIVPTEDPHFLVNIYNRNDATKIIVSYKFSPFQWNNMLIKSKSQQVRFGTVVISGKTAYFYMEDTKITANEKPDHPFFFIHINDKKMDWVGDISPEKWKKIMATSKVIPVRLPMKLIQNLDKKSGDEYYYYLYKGEYYASEIDMSGEDVLTVLESEKENKKERLEKELERVKAREEFTGSSRAPIPEDVQITVWNRDQGKCVKCGSSINLEFDHIIPISKGGSNTARNIQLLCEKCNRSKRDNIGG